MSHSTFVTDDDGLEWVIIHNGDWSGDVEIRLSEKSLKKSEVAETHTIPGAVIRKACATAVVSDAISILEQWDGSSKAAYRAQDALAGRR